MKQKIEYLFFNIYNWYYEMSLYRPQVKAGPLTILMLSACNIGWIVLLFSVTVQEIMHRQFNTKTLGYIAFGIMIFFQYVFNRIFIDNFRYLDIYNKYKDYSKSNPHKKRDTFVSFSIIFLPYFLIILYGVLITIRQLRV